MSDLSGTILAIEVLLLFCSGLFSSSETALFSLTRRERALAPERARVLLAEPRRLLSTVLFGNLVVNLLFFAFAARLAHDSDPWTRVLVGLAALVALVVGGEILPKTLGLRARGGVVRWTTPLLSLLVRVLSPLTEPLVRFLERVNRALAPWMKEERRVTADILADVLEQGAEEGKLLEMEADLLGEILELDRIRVREIMTPRVDAMFLDADGGDREARVAAALEARLSWLPVIEEDADHVLGRVSVRDLVREPERPIRQLVMPVKFVPEVASALDLLCGLRADRTAEAVVVDEWGGTAGIVTAEDVFEEIVGDLREEGEERVPAVVPLGEGRFRLAGSLSIRDWNEQFGLAVVPMEFETVGGFVTARLGRLPRTGDTIEVDQLEMVVHEVRGRRVLTVDVGLRPENGGGEAS